MTNATHQPIRLGPWLTKHSVFATYVQPSAILELVS